MPSIMIINRQYFIASLIIFGSIFLSIFLIFFIEKKWYKKIKSILKSKINNSKTHNNSKQWNHNKKLIMIMFN